MLGFCWGLKPQHANHAKHQRAHHSLDYFCAFPLIYRDPVRKG